jgi:hypothetical protein
MLFVGSPQSTLQEAARQAIRDTFSGSLLFVLLSLIPAYIFARFLRENAEA